MKTNRALSPSSLYPSTSFLKPKPSKRNAITAVVVFYQLQLVSAHCTVLERSWLANRVELVQQNNNNNKTVVLGNNNAPVVMVAVGVSLLNLSFTIKSSIRADLQIYVCPELLSNTIPCVLLATYSIV